MKKIQRFIALLSALTVAASLVAVPVHADGGLVPAGDGWITPGSGGAGAVTPAGAVAISTDMASMLLNEVEEVGQGIREDISAGARWLYSKINEDYCAEAENHRHSFKKQHTMVDGTVNNFYVCEHCGKSGGEVLGSAYNDTVDGMPVNGIDSSGTFYWYPTTSDLTKNGSNNPVWNFVSYDLGGFSGAGFPATKGYVSVDDCGNGISVSYSKSSGLSCKSARELYFYYNLNVPCAGTYVSVSSGTGYDGNYVVDGGLSRKIHVNYKTITTHADDSFEVGSRYCKFYLSDESVYSVFVKHYFGCYKVLPDVPISTSDYVADTRPASYVNQYLVQSGDTYTDSSTSIVNEDNSTIYNPVTGDTTTYDSWTYDYSTRTYTLTDNTNNSTSTVTYGDQNITINEGGNTYNVYYGTVINNNGGDTPAVPDGHKHNYTASVTREPSCTTKGITTYTCADCDDSYQVYTAVLGHDWVIKEQIPTAYSESGEVETSGYTIYECTRCHETYKSTDGTAPASGDGGELAIPDVSGELGAYWDRVKGFFATLPEMFGDLTEFLHDGWTYIPDEVMTLIEFGLSMVVFVGIINWIFKR